MCSWYSSYMGANLIQQSTTVAGHGSAVHAWRVQKNRARRAYALFVDLHQRLTAHLAASEKLNRLMSLTTACASELTCRRRSSCIYLRTLLQCLLVLICNGVGVKLIAAPLYWFGSLVFPLASVASLRKPTARSPALEHDATILQQHARTCPAVHPPQ